MNEEYKQRLKEYVKEDEIYQRWKKGKLTKEKLSDFDYFCIKHCEDIEKLLEENKKLVKLCNEYEHEHNTTFKLWLKEIDKYKQKKQE